MPHHERTPKAFDRWVYRTVDAGIDWTGSKTSGAQVAQLSFVQRHGRFNVCLYLGAY